MRVLAHLSDVHFGREDPAIVEGLLRSLAEARPAVVVVSGDLTQRAKKKQFKAARAFLEDLPTVPRIVVPGNHDVSATNLLERALRPLERYKRYITADLSPFHADAEVAVVGLNTVRLLNRKDGRLNLRQVQHACAQLEAAAAGALRVVVTHHPLDLAAGETRQRLVTRSAMAMRQFAGCGVDLFLSGHLHAGLTVATSARYKLEGYSAVVAHAGTAASTRTRGAANAWNLIRLASDSIEVEQMEWQGKRFVCGRIERYVRGAAGWALRE